MHGDSQSYLTQRSYSLTQYTPSNIESHLFQGAGNIETQNYRNFNIYRIEPGYLGRGKNTLRSVVPD